MKSKIIKNIFLAGLVIAGFTQMAYANEVQLQANQLLKITYRVAHQNPGEPPVMGELQTVEVSKKATMIPITLDGYAVAGLIPISVNGHELPDYANRFNQKQQCSVATDSKNTSGNLKFTLSQHSINCSVEGGVTA